MARIDTTLRQWCKLHQKATLSRQCPGTPNVCCRECCPVGAEACKYEYEYDDDDEDGWVDL